MAHTATHDRARGSNLTGVRAYNERLILSLVRHYLPSYQWVVDQGWHIADCVSRSYDLEGMAVGTVAAGRIGLAVLRRLHRCEPQATGRAEPAAHSADGLLTHPSNGRGSAAFWTEDSHR